MGRGLRATKWAVEHYNQIVGYKITGVTFDDGATGDPFIGLILRKGQREKIAWVLMDQEGNGAGHLGIYEPLYKQEKTA